MPCPPPTLELDSIISPARTTVSLVEIESMELLHVRLFGGLRLDYGGEAIEAVNTPRMQSLLAYLILNREAPQPRRHVAFVLWPDSAEAQALTNLRHVLHFLRQALPDAGHFLVADAHSVQWRPEAPAEIDVVEFGAALGPGTPLAGLRRAVDLYHGELLPACYDDWITPHRERLHGLYSEALTRLARGLEAGRDYGAAIAYARRLLQADPLEEESYRWVMRLHALNDDRAAALHVYHSCLAMLQRELDVEPGEATRRLYEELLSGGRPAVPAIPSRPPLAGRGREWQRLQAEWRAAAGGPRLIVISGEPGIGKTRLAEELGEWAGRQGAITAWAGCYAASRAMAYAPVTNWLRSLPLPSLADVWLVEVSRLLPELAEQRPHLPLPGPLSEDWERRRLYEALGRAILGDRRDLLLSLDDIQWCDAETIQFLHHLLYRDHNARLLLVATLRSGEPAGSPGLADLFDALSHEDRLAEIALEPLSEADTLALAAGVVGGPISSSLAQPLYRGTEGNPLFIVEMVRAGLARGWPPATEPDHGHHALGLELPVKVRQVILARLAQLSPAAGELVALAAVVGREFSFRLVRQAAGMSEEELVHALDELWQRRIVREQGTGSYDFGHDRIREVAYTTLSQARRRLLHRQVAAGLEQVHASDLNPVSAQVADHFEQAGLPEQAVPHWRRAAAAARRLFATNEAVTFIRRAIDGASQLPPEACPEILPRLYEELADLHAVSGSHQQALEALEQAAAGLAPCRRSCVDRARLWRKMAHSLIQQLHYPEAAQALDQAGAALGSEPAGDGAAAEWWLEWIQIRLGRMGWHYWHAEWQAIASLARQVQPVLESRGSTWQKAHYYQDLARMAMRRDRYAITGETLAWSATALAITRELQDEPEIAALEFTHGFVLLWHGDLEEARATLERSLAVARRVGDDLLGLRCEAYLSIWARLVDQPAEVERLVQSCLPLASRLDAPYYQAVGLANRAWLAWRAGRLAESQADARAALDVLTLTPAYPFEWLARWLLLDVALAQGDLAAVVEHSLRMLDGSQQRLPEALTAALEQGVAAAGGPGAAAREALAGAVKLARELHYL